MSDEIIKPAVRCVMCYAEFTDAQIEGAECCPGCGDVGLPMDPAEDVTIRVNWHELRILTIWAERWADHIEGGEGIRTRPVDVVFAIVRRLQEQCPSLAPLTLSGEIALLREEFGDVETHGLPEGGPLPPRIN